MKRHLTYALASLCLCAAAAVADITNITQGTTHPTIQDAVDAAVNGDEIVVDPGTYPGPIFVTGKAITLRSQDPLNDEIVTTTIIEGGGPPSCLTYDSVPSPGAVLEGFTIANGLANRGGGILFTLSEVTVRRCVFAENRALTWGGAINAVSSNVLIEDCMFVHNEAEDEGGAIYAWQSDVTMNNCRFLNNTSTDGGAVFAAANSFVLSRCDFSGNSAARGGAIHFAGGALSLSDCSIVGNTASQTGGGLNIHAQGSVTIANTVVAANTPVQIVGAYTDAGGNLIGAFPPPPAPSACPEDINGDGVVDQADLAALLAVYGQACP